MTHPQVARPRTNEVVEFQQPDRIAYFCGTIERNKDGVTRTLGELQRYNRAHSISSLFVTAVGDESNNQADNPILCIEVPGVPLPKYDGYKLSVASPFAIERQMQRHSFTPSLVHLHSPCTLGLAGIALARKHDIPVVATYHTHFPSYFKYHGFDALEQPARSYLRYFYNRCAMTIAPSQTLAAELRADGIENVEYLPHGVDTKAFHPLHRSHTWRETLLGERAHDTTVLLYVGRLVWEKNLRVLVDAMLPLLRERTDVALAIIGTGPAEKELRELLPEAHFLGFQAGQALAEGYASSDVFIFPSDTETFGNVTLEALASGLPCVVANAGGSMDLVADGETGFIARAQSPEDFRAACELLISDQSLRRRMAHNAFVAAQQYDWDEILQRLHVLYGNAVQKHQQTAELRTTRDTREIQRELQREFQQEFQQELRQLAERWHTLVRLQTIYRRTLARLIARRATKLSQRLFMNSLPENTE